MTPEAEFVSPQSPTEDRLNVRRTTLNTESEEKSDDVQSEMPSLLSQYRCEPPET